MKKTLVDIEIKYLEARNEYYRDLKSIQDKCQHEWGPFRDTETQEYCSPYFVRKCNKCKKEVKASDAS